MSSITNKTMTPFSKEMDNVRLDIEMQNFRQNLAAYRARQIKNQKESQGPIEKVYLIGCVFLIGAFALFYLLQDNLETIKDDVKMKPNSESESGSWFPNLQEKKLNSTIRAATNTLQATHSASPTDRSATNDSFDFIAKPVNQSTSNTFEDRDSNAMAKYLQRKHSQEKVSYSYKKYNSSVLAKKDFFSNCQGMLFSWTWLLGNNEVWKAPSGNLYCIQLTKSFCEQKVQKIEALNLQTSSSAGVGFRAGIFITTLINCYIVSQRILKSTVPSFSRAAVLPSADIIPFFLMSLMIPLITTTGGSFIGEVLTDVELPIRKIFCADRN